MPGLLKSSISEDTDEMERLIDYVGVGFARKDLLHSNTYEMIEFVLFRMYLPPNSDVLQLLAAICNSRKAIRSHEVLHLPPNF